MYKGYLHYIGQERYRTAYECKCNMTNIRPSTWNPMRLNVL